MYRYRYRGKDLSGQRRRGEVVAASEQEAVRILAEQGIFPTQLVVAEEILPAGYGGPPYQGSGYPPPERPVIRRPGPLAAFLSPPTPIIQLAAMSRELAFLLEAGVELSSALFTLAEQAPSARLARIFSQLGSRVAMGEPLSSALRSFQGYFSPLYISLVEAGERGGFLPRVLRQLAGMLEEEVELKRQLSRQLIYPALVLVVAWVAAFIFTYLLGLAVFRIFVVGIPLLFAGALLLNLLARSKTVAYPLRELLGSLPLVGSLIHRYALARSVMVLSYLWEAGLPLPEALEATARTSWLMRLSRAWHRVREAVLEGLPLHVGMERAGGFPRDLISVTAVSETSASVGEGLRRVAGYIKADADLKAATLAKLVGPVLTVLMGILVLFFLIAFWQSYFTQLLNLP